MSIYRSFLNNAGHLLINKAKSPSAGLSTSEFEVARIGFSTADIDDREAIYPSWFFSSRLGQPRQVDTVKLRNFAQSSWVQMVLNTFKKEISNIEWKIVPIDEDDGIDHTENIKKCTDFFNKINNNNQNVVDINSEAVTDVGEIDAGVWNYVYSVDSYTIGEVPVYDTWGRESGETEISLILKPLGQRALTQVKSVDGASILKQVDIHKNLLRYYQFSFKHPRRNPTPFDVDEIEYLILNNRSYSIYGFSPVQSIQQELQVLIQGTRFNKDLYLNNAVPEVLVSLPNLPRDKLKKLKREWLAQYKGKPHQVGFINWLIQNVHQLTSTNRDLEWLEGQKWYFKIVFAAFGVSPTEAGFFENANKSNDEGQARVTVRNAIKPYLALIEKIHTRKTITEILQMEDSGLRYKYFPKDHAEEKIEFEQDKWEIENGAMTINEYRKKKGKETVEWGDEPLKKPGQETSFNFGGNPMNPEDNPPKDKDTPKPKEPDKNDKFHKFLELDPGDDVINKAEDYSDFLLRTFDNFERKVLHAADELQLEKSYTTKFFGGFLKSLFNSVNTVAFAANVKKFLKTDLVAGLVSAENELGVDIGFTEAYQDKLNLLQQQQINGYNINGKPWMGIKGVSKDIQQKVISVVQADINEHKSLSEVKDDIKGVFDGFSEWRANMIGRTETNRTLNSAKLLGYKESGLTGKKVWKTAFDDRTSDICKRLSNQEQDLDDEFIDPGTMKTYPHPPGHPSCRSSLAFHPK